ncbi:MAG: hypothetical protein M3Y03_04780 [Verrucomicrobiota bacterium]|nr:hypothetical protein [Verrucomicrobiota bacterium]
MQSELEEIEARLKRAMRERAKGSDELRALRASLAARRAASSPLQKEEPRELPPPGFIASEPSPPRRSSSFQLESPAKE